MTGAVSPLQAARAALAADARHADPSIWITRLPDDAVLDAARRLEREGPQGRPLWGVPFAVKDNIDVACLPTTAACPAFSYQPQSSAPAVQRLLDAGALLLGKTNLDQFATGLSGVRSPYGVPRNVFDPRLVPGGSSSGSACVVAAGIAAFALGTDTAGSGRVPAMFGNIVGLKPTLGSVSARGTVPACRSLDTISVFARTVDEALAVARAAAGYDDADPYARPAPFPHLRRGRDPEPARVAIADRLPECDPSVSAAYARAAGLFDTVPVDIAPFLEIARLLYDGPWVAERTAGLRAFIEAHDDALHPVTRDILRSGYGRTSVDAFASFHRLAACRRLAQRLFADVDALMLPTAPFTPSLDACAADPIGPNSRLGAFTNFVNLCDLAAIAVPAGFGPDGCPAGVTLIGPAWSEGRLAALADRVHRSLVGVAGATGQPLPPASAPDALGPDEVALFCVGAHMAGLPLNHQLRERGGRFLRAADTEDRYRLYALTHGLASDRPDWNQSGRESAGQKYPDPSRPDHSQDDLGPALCSSRHHRKVEAARLRSYLWVMDAHNPVLAGLIRKRQEIAGELETAYGRIASLTECLRSLDGAIRLFGPDLALDEIAPKQRRYVAQPGEISRAIRETLRDAAKPLTAREITLGVMAARGMEPHDATLFGTMQKRVMASLRNLQLGGSVRSHREPGSHLRWTLTG